MDGQNFNNENVTVEPVVEAAPVMEAAPVVEPAPVAEEIPTYQSEIPVYQAPVETEEAKPSNALAIVGLVKAGMICSIIGLVISISWIILSMLGVVADTSAYSDFSSYY